MFSEAGDPVKDLNIGAILVSSDYDKLRKMPVSDLEDIYEKITHPGKIRLCIDDVNCDYDSLPGGVRMRFNANIYKALKYAKTQLAIAVINNVGYKKGEVVKVTYKKELYIGYVLFNNNNTVKTDRSARVNILCPRNNDIILRAPLKLISLATPQEKESLNKECFGYQFQVRKLELKNQMRRAYRAKKIEKYNNLTKEYNKIMARISS